MSIIRNSTVAIFSDIHIGVHRDSKFWHEITWKWAEWFIDDITRKGIKDVIFSGDYFHTRDEVSVDTLHFGSRLLELFKDFNVIMIVGNHDCFLKDTSEVNSISQYSHWPNITIVDKPITVDVFGKRINFIPWGIKLDQIPNADITFGHFEIKLFRMNTYALCDDGFTADEILSKSLFVISGHFHLRDEKHYDQGKILYVGNPFQMDFNDAGTVKGYYTLNIPTGETEFIENKVSPKHHNVTLSHLISEKTLTDSVKALFNNNMIKFKVDRRVSPDDIEFLLNVYKSLNPSQFNVEYESNFSEYDLDEDKPHFYGVDLQQAIIEFIEMMDTNNKKELITYTIDLYQKTLK